MWKSLRKLVKRFVERIKDFFKREKDVVIITVRPIKVKKEKRFSDPLDEHLAEVQTLERQALRLMEKEAKEKGWKK